MLLPDWWRTWLNVGSFCSREAAVRGHQSRVGHTGSDPRPPGILLASQNPQRQHHLWYDAEKREKWSSEDVSRWAEQNWPSIMDYVSGRGPNKKTLRAKYGPRARVWHLWVASGQRVLGGPKVWFRGSPALILCVLRQPVCPCPSLHLWSLFKTGKTTNVEHTAISQCNKEADEVAEEEADEEAASSGGQLSNIYSNADYFAESQPLPEDLCYTTISFTTASASESPVASVSESYSTISYLPQDESSVYSNIWTSILSTCHCSCGSLCPISSFTP